MVATCRKEMITMHPNPLIDDENFEIRRVVARKGFSAKREKD
jgi:hypothetical protein